MNAFQREAVQQAIVFEEDWIYRAEREAKRNGTDLSSDSMYKFHKDRLERLREDM